MLTCTHHFRPPRTRQPPPLLLPRFVLRNHGKRPLCPSWCRGHTGALTSCRLPSLFLFTGCACSSFLASRFLVALSLLPISTFPPLPRLHGGALSLWAKGPPSPSSPSQSCYQVHVRYEISQDSGSDPKGPNPIGLSPENPQVEILARLGPALLPHAPAAQLVLPIVLRVTRRRQDGPIGQGQEYLDEH